MAKIEKLPKSDLLPGDHTLVNDNRPTVSVYVDTKVTWCGGVDPDDSWDRPDTESQFIGVTVRPGGNWPVRKSVNPGNAIYVVVIKYSTGDTFGNDSGCCACVGVENTKEDAEELRRIVRERVNNGAYSFDTGGNSVVFKGWTYYLGSWLGYFESVESVWVEETVVRGD